jgi:hypothetical protein
MHSKYVQSALGSTFKDRFGRCWTKVRFLEDAEYSDAMTDLDFKIRSGFKVTDKDLKRLGLDRIREPAPRADLEDLPNEE